MATSQLAQLAAQVADQVLPYLPEAVQSHASNVSPVALVALLAAVPAAAVSLAASAATSSQSSRKGRLPPHVGHWVPFLGSMISFGMRPLDWLAEQRKQHGDIFTFTMFGREMTYVLGPDGNHAVLNGKLADISAELAYNSLTKPVFGADVVYDTSNPVFMEQKRFVKAGLSAENLRSYVPLIEAETLNYFTRWQGQQGEGELATALAELTIMTASRCLMGEEVRSKLDESVAQLYHDLDQGFQPINFLFEKLPLPTYRRRDIAQKKMADLFLDIMKERRATGRTNNNDVLQVLMDAEYKNGTKLTDIEAAHLMIALLMAGQHTSSTTGTWCMSFLAANPNVFADLATELHNELGGDWSRPLDFDLLKRLPLLDACIRETLRLRSPIYAIMRKVVRPVEIMGHVVPAGHYLCASPAVSQRDPEVYEDPMAFKPRRWLDTSNNAQMQKILRAETDMAAAEDFGFGVVGGSARSNYLPFGAGRHRCIGEPFAYVQLKTIIATLVREFATFKFVKGPEAFPKEDFTSMIVMPEKPIMIKYTRRERSPLTGAAAVAAS
ncbi:Lanosterol 14-alpha-demethylase [Allomyces arbusculus]|nr:Lanosterol 14-alpha-demethylase [Allomyces arbusculus]